MSIEYVDAETLHNMPNIIKIISRCLVSLFTWCFVNCHLYSRGFESVVE